MRWRCARQENLTAVVVLMNKNTMFRQVKTNFVIKYRRFSSILYHFVEHLNRCRYLRYHNELGNINLMTLRTVLNYAPYAHNNPPVN